MVLIRHMKVHVVKVSALDSLKLWRYTLWKIGFLTSHEASHKHVFRVKSHNFSIENPNEVIPIALEILRDLVSYVWISESDIKYWAWGIMYKFTLLNKPELNQVYHSLYNFFLGRIQGVKIGGVSDNTLSYIIYRIILS